MNTRIVGFVLPVVVGLLLFTSPVAASPAEQDNPAGEEPKELRQVIPPAEREALGLNDTGWTGRHGKVHPNVYEALDKQDELIRRDPFMAGYQHGRGVGFEGAAYVQVHLKHEQKGKRDSAGNKAAIKALQSKVLSQLSAAEFYVEHPFQTLPGILGYVNRAGLEKLKANADVVAVCVDDKPFPRRPAPVFKVELPPLKPGDPATEAAQGRFWGSGGKVEREVYQALGIYERVRVTVGMRCPSEGSPEQKPGIARDIEDRVLAAMTAHEFRLSTRTPIGSLGSACLTGWVNVEGLKKQENQPEVEHVGMPADWLRVPPVSKKRP